MPAISIKNVSKTYPLTFTRLRNIFGLFVKEPVEALRDVSLDVEEGEIYGLIGKNGAGKTTLAKIIATLVQPTCGSVTVKGYDSVKDEVKVRSKVGLATAEERSFYWRLSCQQNLLFFARLYGMKDGFARKRIAEVFEQFGLSELAKRRFSNISTGNKQRLAVARALLPKPPVLLLDEPTRSLDPIAAAEVRKLIASLEGVSVLLTSHNLSEIEELCDRVSVISRGSIRATDEPANLRKYHKQIQTVRINLKGTFEESLITLNNLKDVGVKEENGTTTLTFDRETDDDLLGETISELHDRGAKILDIETEKPTLLEVLESYE